MLTYILDPTIDIISGPTIGIRALHIPVSYTHLRAHETGSACMPGRALIPIVGPEMMPIVGSCTPLNVGPRLQSPGC